ncbi:uncharacterized protein [Centruroides vittatus]|uniref:uncharacterized protein n=1 Tax=Centruroides vittatus TaxID=120091 RepID=UPI00350F5ABA
MEEEVATVFDYENMYLSVKIESCKEALLQFLFDVNPELARYNEEISEMANLVCYESCFSFNGQAYRQKRGVPMGSPVSGILCELVIRKLEKKVLYDFKKDVLYFKRYVEDVLIVWRNNSMIGKFVKRVNSNNDGLKLKMEQKSSLAIHFLDINIVFKEGHFSTNMYIKPTHSPLYIPSHSNDPYHYKLAAFRALIRRAFIYGDDVVNRDKEIDRITQVAESLGYKKGTIAGLVKKYEMGTTGDSKYVPSKITKFTYNKNSKSIIKEIANRKDTRMVLKRALNLYTILRNDKDRIKKEEKARVYKIPYENAELGIEKDYIGITTRSLGKRLKEHKYDVKKGSNTTVLSQYAQTQGSVIKWEEADIVKPLSSPTLAGTAEKIEIYKSKLGDACINARDADSLPTAWKFVVKKCITNS